MRTISFIIILAVLTSCSTKKTTDIGFFKGEWISDSVYTPANDHWREFLYFDSVGIFNRTTLWGPNYVLSKDLLLKDSSIYEDGKELFRVYVIDSNNIILKGKNYYGSFSRDPWPTIGSWREDLKNSRISDKNRKALIGTWKFFNYRLTNSDTIKLYPEEYLKTKDFMRLRHHKINNRLSVRLDVDHFFIQSDSAETKYNYILNPDKIDINNTDYIIGVPYKLNGDTLTLNDSPMYGLTNVIRFLRE